MIKALCLGPILIGCFAFCNALFFKRNLIYEVSKVELTSNFKYVNTSCQLTQLSSGTQLSYFMNFVQDLDRLLMIQMRLYHFENDEFRKSFVDVNIDLCQFYKKANGNPLFLKLYSLIRRTGNIPIKCPIKKGLYSLVNYTVDAFFMPAVLPSDRFRLEIRAYCDDDPVEEVLGLTMYMLFRNK